MRGRSFFFTLWVTALIAMPVVFPAFVVAALAGIPAIAELSTPIFCVAVVFWSIIIGVVVAVVRTGAWH